MPDLSDLDWAIVNLQATIDAHVEAAVAAAVDAERASHECIPPAADFDDRVVDMFGQLDSAEDEGEVKAILRYWVERLQAPASIDEPEVAKAIRKSEALVNAVLDDGRSAVVFIAATDADEALAALRVAASTTPTDKTPAQIERARWHGERIAAELRATPTDAEAET